MLLNLKRLIVLSLLCSFFTACSFFEKKNRPIIREEIEIVELDQLPMYGSTPEYGSLQKTPEQIEADRAFLSNSDSAQPSRTQACVDYTEFGWYYLNKGDTETAMRRVNQAWQLDSTNPDVYVLFAAILNAREDHQSALDMLDRGISIRPNYIALYDMYLSESIDIFRETGNGSHIRNLIKMLDKLNIEDYASSLKVAKIKKEAEEYLK